LIADFLWQMGRNCHVPGKLNKVHKPLCYDSIDYFPIDFLIGMNSNIAETYSLIHL